MTDKMEDKQRADLMKLLSDLREKCAEIAEDCVEISVEGVDYYGVRCAGRIRQIELDVAVDRFLQAARRPQGREVPEWISIAETKPEIGEDVWLKTNGGSMIKGRLTEDDDYWCDELDEWLGGAGDLFTHWKPIAAAPEGEGRSE
jgi:hypothetical protein